MLLSALVVLQAHVCHTQTMCSPDAVQSLSVAQKEAEEKLQAVTLRNSVISAVVVLLVICLVVGVQV